MRKENYLLVLYLSMIKRDATLPLHTTGSGIIQLAGIILPLSYYKSRLVIIEEPEVNLHVDMRLKLLVT